MGVGAQASISLVEQEHEGEVVLEEAVPREKMNLLLGVEHQERKSQVQYVAVVLALVLALVLAVMVKTEVLVQ